MVPRSGLPPRTTNLSMARYYGVRAWKWVAAMVRDGAGLLGRPAVDAEDVSAGVAEASLFSLRIVWIFVIYLSAIKSLNFLRFDVVVSEFVIVG